jgi:hypothetical protein
MLLSGLTELCVVSLVDSWDVEVAALDLVELSRGTDLMLALGETAMVVQ